MLLRIDAEEWNALLSFLTPSGRTVGTSSTPRTVIKAKRYVFEASSFDTEIDTLPRRQSEKLLGAWAKARGIRDQLVIATKYTIGYKNDDADVKLKVCMK